jgi:hypothetical protein
MNDHEVDLNRVEQDERWLREILEPARAIGTAAIKHRVRIAVQEEWLRMQLGNADAGPSIARMRKAVRTAINGAAETTVPQHVINEKTRPLSLSPWERALRSIRVSTWLRIGFAAAAMLAIALVIPRFDPSDSASDTADLTAWTRTADENAADELDREIESLRVEFDAAGQAIVEGWSADPTGWDDLLEENTTEGS